MLSTPIVQDIKAAITEVAIIGAGSAGCLLANLLDKAGTNCLLIEKSRGMGGRCSRRHISTDKTKSYAIDLGGADISPEKVTNLILKDILDYWYTSGYICQWKKKVSRFNHLHEDSKAVTTLCGAPSMNTLHSNIASHINILTQSRVCKLERADGNWHLFDDKGDIVAISKKLVVTAPPEQTRALLKTVDALSNISLPDTLPHESLPQYVCAIGFDQPLAMDADVYQGGHLSLHKSIRERSKPDRTYPSHLADIWVLHSTYEWAQEQRHSDSNAAAAKLTDAFCKHFGIEAKPMLLTSHYWRMAKYKTTTHPPCQFVWNEQHEIGFSGDWLGGGGTVGALTSAIELHQAMLGSAQTIVR